MPNFFFFGILASAFLMRGFFGISFFGAAFLLFFAAIVDFGILGLISIASKLVVGDFAVRVFVS